MRNRFLLIPTLAVLAGTSAARAADLDFQIHGFASQGYVETHGDAYEDGWYGRDTNEAGTFEFNEFGINVVATPIDRLRIGVQLIAYDLGEYGNDEVQLDWAFGEYQLPVTDNFEVSVVAGRFKTGHAFYNDYRDLDMTRTSVFLPSTVYSASFRDFFLAANGAQLNGMLDAGKLGSFTLSGFLGTQNIEEEDSPMADIFGSAITQTVSIGIANLTTELDEFDYITVENFNGAHLEWNTPLDGLRLKVSSLYADNFKAHGTLKATVSGAGNPFTALNGTVGYTDIDIFVDHWYDITTGAEYVWGDLTVASEVTTQYYTASSVTGDLDLPGTPGAPDSPSITQNIANRTLSAYGSATYQLSMLPGIWKRVSVYGAFNWGRSTNPNTDASSYTRTGAVALRYDIIDHFLIKGEFERRQETSATGTREYGNIFSLKTTFDF